MNYDQILNQKIQGVKPSGIRKFFDILEEMTDAISLGIGEPDFVTPWHIRDAGIYSLEKGFTKYTSNAGMAELRREIAAYQERRFRLHYDFASQIIVTVGGSEAIDLALRCLINPGDEVIIPVPAFPLYEEIVKLCRGVSVFLDTASDGFQIRQERLAPLMTEKTKAIILNTPNNPTGCVYTGESLQAVHDAVVHRPVFVICDDVYRQLVYLEDYHSFAEFRDLRGQLLLVQSFSKPYAMTGWRMGYLLADSAVKERLELVHQFMVVSTPAPFQKACINALDFNPHELVETYRRRRAYILQRLREMELPVVEPMGAFYVFPSIQEFGLPSGEFCTRMIREAGLAATPGACFGTEGYIRLTYCYSDEELREGLDRLERFVGSLRGADHER